MTRRLLDYAAAARDQISERERAQSRASRLQRRKAANDALASLRRGDIINITHGRRGGLAVVLEPARDGDDPRPLVLTETPLGGPDFVGRLLGRVGTGRVDVAAQAGRTPQPARAARSGVGAAIGGGRSGRAVGEGQAQRPARNPTSTPNWPRCVSRLRRHPAHHLPDREAKARLAERYLRIERDNEQIQQKVAAATNSLARTFDRIVVLLTERGFIERRGR